MPDSLTSNQYWGGLNRRYDKRATLLRSLGFEYVDSGHGFAMYSRRRGSRTVALPTAFLFHADKRAWFVKLRNILN